MATTTTTPSVPQSPHVPAPSQREQRGRRRGASRGENRRRGGRGYYGNNNTTVNADANNNTESHSHQTSLPHRDQTRPATSSSVSERGRGRVKRGRGRGGRGGTRNGGPQADRIEAGSGRRFGGQLTRTEDNAEPALDHEGPQGQVSDGSLNAAATSFVPGQVPSSRTGDSSAAPPSAKSKGKQAQRQPRTVPKSVADDMPTRIHDDIAHGIYECPICTSELGRKSKVWSCDLCWTVFHLTCIKKWSRNEGSVFAASREEQQQQQQQQPQGENVVGLPSSGPSARQWRCPGCNLPHDTLPSVYTCWCEKEIDPRPLPGLPPHSCGQTCSKSRKGCPHPCDLICHAGSCPPCKAMGPTQTCFCGLQESRKRCVDTDYEHGWSCGEVCGEMLPCLEHTCARPCHEGLCGECVERVDVQCYCGKVEKTLRCGEREEKKTSERLLKGVDTSTDHAQIETWIGSFRCGSKCDREYDCGVHCCEEDCHPQEKEIPHCPFSPDIVTHCPCGKTPLEEIPGYKDKPRTSCQDTVPNCEKSCGKILPCGHTCPTICHAGQCPPCFLNVDVKCRCGRSTFKTMCQQGVDEPPLCFRVCGTAMSCGRHSCAERCCPGGPKSQERQATKRKLKSLNVSMRDDDIEAEHICTRVCGRPLKCGQHNCPDLCHKGACTTCREAIFEEITCNCGRTVLHPPLPCGTQPPACPRPCERPKRCGHPQTQHNCHTDKESCPKCPYLTEKRCLCGKKTLKNQPCWLVDGRCGLVCGELLKCGSHNCTKTCHRPGDCEDATGSCQQPCGKIKKICGHPCTDICHAPFPCQEKTPCKAMVPMTCGCGRLKQEKRCNASRDKSRAQAPSNGTQSLKCDDECARLQRNRSVASALNVSIDPQTTTSAMASTQESATLPYSDETLDMYIQLSSSSTLNTLQSYESTLHTLALSPSERSARFQPARSQLRAFVHSLAADWGFMSESFDPEPNRHVLVFKAGGWLPPSLRQGGSISTSGSVGVGIGIRGISVGECVKMRERERMKEREARRVAAEKARSEREAPGSVSPAAGPTTADDGGGWAQVVSRSKKAGAAASGAASPYGFGETTKSATTPGGRFGTLVLKSGVGMSKGLSSKDKKNGKDDEVAEDWKEEIEKEERKEEEEDKTSEDQNGLSGDVPPPKQTVSGAE